MKTCFKCHRELPLTEFYAHPQMADGHLNKCKDCNKRDTATRAAILSRNPEWAEKEAERHRIKARTARLLGRDKKQTPASKSASNHTYRRKHPHKRKAQAQAGNAIRDGRLVRKPCEKCGDLKVEAHHEDYSKPLEVKWLCKRHHAERHVEIRNEIRRLRLSL